MTTYPFETALAAAHRLRELLVPGCKRIEIAGSIRRRKPEVKDIELVAVPLIETASGGDLWGDEVEIDRLQERITSLSDHLWPRTVEIHRRGGTVEHGRRVGRSYQALEFEGIPVDLFVVRPPAQWGVIFAIRTGPGEWNEAIVTDCQRWFRRVQGGQVLHLGKVVPCPEERDFFEAVGQPWVDPSERSLSRVKVGPPTRSAA